VKKERRIVIAGQSPLFNCLLKVFIQRNGYGIVVAIAGNGREALEMVGRVKPDCVVMESVLHGVNSVEFVKTIRKEVPGTLVIAYPVRWVNRIQAVRLVKAGVRGYLPLCADEEAMKRTFDRVFRNRTAFPEEIEDILADRDYEKEHQKYCCLTAREREIVQFVALGYSNHEIQIKPKKPYDILCPRLMLWALNGHTIIHLSSIIKNN
jgi:DNA-binding NarL/FixJ family response regulator